MIKIKALNESSSSSESEDDDNPRLSSEAQEAQAKSMYEMAQRLTITNEVQQSLEIFEKILTLPYLNENLNKTLSPVQHQIRLGCLKCLSTLYRSGPTKNLREALKVLEMITKLEPTNVNFWYRLGKVALENEDLDVAFDAFQCTLSYSPGHWGSIENLVTISYVLHDFLGCLRFCTMGLKKDSAFVRGLVFRDHIFKSNPWIKLTFDKNRSGFESLFLKGGENYSDSTKIQYLNEARTLVQRYTEQKIITRKEEQEEENEIVKSPFILNSPSFVELSISVIKFYNHIKALGTLLRPVDLTCILSNLTLAKNSLDETSNENYADNTEEGSQPSSMLRSRSSSDDKDCCPNFSTIVSESDEKPFEDDSQTITSSIHLKPGGGSADEESAQRKKARRDVKWWQIEGKRRSQRVRGNLIPPPNKPKTESSFTETLKNIIPAPLLIEDSIGSRDDSKSSQDVITNEIDNNLYFGTSKEAINVKCFIKEWGKTDIIIIITKLVRFLSRQCKGRWPSELSEKFIELFDLYRALVPTIVSSEYDGMNDTDIEDDVFTTLTRAELALEANPEINSINKESMPILEELNNTFHSNPEFNLRKKWLKVRDYLQRCKNDCMDYTYLNWDLNTMLEILNDKPTSYVCFTPSQKDNIISIAYVKEKVNFVKKIESLSKITELYEENKYEELIEILLFSLTSDKEGAEDFNNRIYLTEAYFHLGKVECIEQCQEMFEYGVKNCSEEVLSKCITLLRNIWDEMKDRLSVKQFKLIINILTKLLMFNEKQNLNEDFIITESWCLLHSVLCYLERKEPAFYTEEDTVPNSILALQFGHESLSKSSKCCLCEGQFLSYTITVLLEMQNLDEYWGFEETKNCFDQAVLCLYSHPNKKYKLKNLKDHGALGVKLNWSACCQLYKYYKLEQLPEVDSISSRSISAEVEYLFQRIVQEIPENLKPLEQFNKMKAYVEGDIELESSNSVNPSFETFDIYYLLADFHLKNKDLKKAVEFYIWDLSVCSIRFDTWAAIALAKAEEIICTINSCNSFRIEEIIPKAEAVIRCFKQALRLDVANSKVRIEFGSFLYSLHSVYSRELKFHTDQLSLEMFEEIEKKKSEYLLEAQSWFEPNFKTNGSDGGVAETSQNEEVWINHYMLGKISEKLHPNEPELFLKQYELAGKLLHEKGAPYPTRINYCTPSEFALEALEIYYRIHASILSYVERERVTEFNQLKEELLLSFLSRAEDSPFVKSKRGREASDTKKKKGVDDVVSKKDAAVISSLVKQMVNKVEEIMNQEDSDSSVSTIHSSELTTESESEDEDELNRPSTSRPLPPMRSLSLTAFKERMQEKELKDAKLFEEAKKLQKPTLTEIPKADSHLHKNLPHNPFYSDFTTVSYGRVISHCLKAMKECILRYPQCFKAYFRLAYSYQAFIKDYKKAREYFMGNNNLDASKIVGLYGERKPSNFFNGIWRIKQDDIDRPGSFPFHMSKSIQLLLVISRELNDHQLLAEIGIQLAKVPDPHNVFLFTEDREQFSKEAMKSCAVAAKKSISIDRTKLLECGTLIYDTYTKFQKHYPRDNVISAVLLEVYRDYVLSQSYAVVDPKQIVLSDAVKFFQHVAWTSRTTGGSLKSITSKLSENSSNSDKAVPAAIPCTTGKQPIIKKTVPQRRMSDQSRANETSTTNLTVVNQVQTPTSQKIVTKPRGTMPPLFPASDLANMGLRLPPPPPLMHNQGLFVDMAAYVSQMQLFAKLSSGLRDDHITTTNFQPESLSFNAFKEKMNSKSSTASITQFISNASNAIAASFGSKKNEGSASQNSADDAIRKTHSSGVDHNSLQINDKSTNDAVRKNQSGVDQRSLQIDDKSTNDTIRKKQSRVDQQSVQTIDKSTNDAVRKKQSGVDLRSLQINDKNTNDAVRKNQSGVDQRSLQIDDKSTNDTVRKKQSRVDQQSVQTNDKSTNDAGRKKQSGVDQRSLQIDDKSTNDTVRKKQSRVDQRSLQINDKSTNDAVRKNQSGVDQRSLQIKDKSTSHTLQSSTLANSQTLYERQAPNIREVHSQFLQDAILFNKPIAHQSSKPAFHSTDNLGHLNKLYKPRPVHIARKSTTGFVRGSTKPSYPNTGMHPYMTSSPFKSQLTAVVRPSLSGYSLNLVHNRSPQPSNIGTPKPAHSQSIFQKRLSVSSNEEPNVVDLTTKSPEKILGFDQNYDSTSKNGRRSDPIIRPLKRPIQTTVETEKRYPLPPKKKHHMMPPSPKTFGAEDNNVEVMMEDDKTTSLQTTSLSLSDGTVQHI